MGNIGAGVFGEVYKVKKVETGDCYAAKIKKKGCYLYSEYRLIKKVMGKIAVP